MLRVNNCQYCKVPLVLIHPWNSSWDVEMCDNIMCPKFRNPQRYILNPDNRALFNLYDSVVIGLSGKANLTQPIAGASTRLNDEQFELSDGKRRRKVELKI